MGVWVENRSQTFDTFNFITLGFGLFPHFGAIIDTAGFGAGISFVPVGFNVGGGVTYTFLVNESDDPNMANATVVSEENLSVPYSTINRTSANSFSTSVPFGEGGFVSALSVFNVKRYIQLEGDAVGAAAQPGNMFVFTRAIPETTPVKNIV